MASLCLAVTEVGGLDCGEGYLNWKSERILWKSAG